MPSDAFYYAFNMVERLHDDYFTTDVLSDALGRDKSSRLYVQLKKERQLVSNISAYITGSLDKGLLVISGKLSEGVSFEAFDEALWKVLAEICSTPLSRAELNRIMAKIRTSREFQEQGLLNRAMNLSIYELLGDAEMINHEGEQYQNITPEAILRVANEVLRKENCSILNVKSIPNAE